MPSTRVVIGSPIGLHARPARLLVETAGRHDCPVEVGRSREALVSATSILAVMSLGVQGGEEVVLSADGDGADAAIAELAALLVQDLDIG